jgi:hypothetical protein
MVLAQSYCCLRDIFLLPAIDTIQEKILFITPQHKIRTNKSINTVQAGHGGEALSMRRFP